MNKFKLPSVFFFSKYINWPERNTHIRVVIGKKIDLP